MLHCILEKHQVHHWIVIIVGSETFLDVGEQLVIRKDIIETVLAVHAAGEVTEDEVLWGVTEITVERIS